MAASLKKRIANFREAAARGHEQALRDTVAASSREPWVLETLLHASDSCGRTAFILAASKGRTACLDYLMQIDRHQVQMVDKEGRNALSHAVGEGHEECATLLLQHLPKRQVMLRDANGMIPLLWAATCMQTSVIPLLLKHDGAVQVRVKATCEMEQGIAYGANALMILAGPIECAGSVTEADRELAVELLLAVHPGVQLLTTDVGGWNAAMCAVRSGREGCLLRMLAHARVAHAQLAAVNGQGRCALRVLTVDIVCGIYCGAEATVRILQLLLGHGIQYPQATLDSALEEVAAAQPLCMGAEAQHQAWRRCAELLLLKGARPGPQSEYDSVRQVLHELVPAATAPRMLNEAVVGLALDDRRKRVRLEVVADGQEL